MHYFLCTYCQTLEKCSDAALQLMHWHAGCQYLCQQVKLHDLIQRGQLRDLILHDVQTEQRFTEGVMETVFPLQLRKESHDKPTTP